MFLCKCTDRCCNSFKNDDGSINYTSMCSQITALATTILGAFITPIFCYQYGIDHKEANGLIISRMISFTVGFGWMSSIGGLIIGACIGKTFGSLRSCCISLKNRCSN
jgi:hypothetical protein